MSEPYSPGDFAVTSPDDSVRDGREFSADKGPRMFASFDAFAADDDGERMRMFDAEPMGRPAVRERITPDRTDNFDLETGQFRDPDTGLFEPGGPPPDYDAGADRFRAMDGQFKDRPADHFDEPAEVRLEKLWPEG